MKTLNIHITKKMVITSSVISMLALSGCSKNSLLSPNCLSGSWIENVSTELNAWTTATQLYSESPTTVNCENNKQAGLDYISALDKIKNCVPTVSTSDFDLAQQEAKDEINATTCN